MPGQLDELEDVLHVRDDVIEIAYGLTKAVERDRDVKRDEWLNRARERIGRFVESLLQSKLSPEEKQKKKIELMTDLIGSRIRSGPTTEAQVYFAASEALSQKWQEACRKRGIIGKKYELFSLTDSGNPVIECYDSAKEAVRQAKQWSDQKHADIRVKDQTTGQVYREQTLLDLYREAEGT
jgi:hypothetical protein